LTNHHLASLFVLLLFVFFLGGKHGTWEDVVHSTSRHHSLVIGNHVPGKGGLTAPSSNLDHDTVTTTTPPYQSLTYYYFHSYHGDNDVIDIIRTVRLPTKEGNGDDGLLVKEQRGDRRDGSVGFCW